MDLCRQNIHHLTVTFHHNFLSFYDNMYNCTCRLQLYAAKSPYVKYDVLLTIWISLLVHLLLTKRCMTCPDRLKTLVFVLKSCKFSYLEC